MVVRSTPRPRAVAVDEATALTIDPNGNAAVLGSSTAYFLEAPIAPPGACKSKTPLTYQNVAVYRIRSGTNGGSFSLPDWSGSGGTDYTVSANAGVLTSTQVGGSSY